MLRNTAARVFISRVSSQESLDSLFQLKSPLSQCVNKVHMRRDIGRPKAVGVCLFLSRGRINWLSAATEIITRYHVTS